MEKLINPVPRAISVSKTGKNIVFGVKPDMDIVAPYEGKPEIIGNTIRIKHKINGKTYYSDIENVGKMMTSTSRVSQNDKIGETGSADIVFKVLDENLKPFEIDDVFGKDNKDNDKDKTNITGLDVLKTFTFPVSLVKSAGKYAFNKLVGNNESIEVDENTINEDVERIKQLMK